MAKKQALPAECQKLVDQMAGQVLDLTYGQGCSPAEGARFEEVEEAGVLVGDALARAVMQQAMRRQATTVPAERCGCGTPLEPRDSEPRTLSTRRGEIGWNEPSGYCPLHRRAFFPSEPPVGPACG
jgi:hypothetical protein